ncbi:hypothetical protein GCM10010435_26920 [Winogradskya consettensis]|uniref:Nickel/cobalt efflux system n=1 Tax=Winogradskya consettensis TaxID=113560 RepID=A0A919SB08_9ACTN|nr:sulfite exporter TauE/SafE family protein [Actinoplanes consettensis]GIM68197.1 hypothetical protein Aco04nite_09710 [Actinoplanes consettensis]
MTTTAPGRARRAPAWLLAPLVAMALIVLPASAAWAHPLDISRQTSYVTVATDAVTVEVDLAAGVLVAPAFIADLDADSDKTFTPAEGRQYAQRLLAKVSLRIDDAPVPLTLSGVELPTYPQARAGYGVLHVTATAPLAPADGGHTLFYRNGFAPQKPQYEVAVLAPKKAPVTIGEQHRDEAQQQVRTTFTVLGDTAVAPQRDSHPSGWGVERLLSMVENPSGSLGVTLIALVLAMVLGAFHALTPGHGKTMMAAYLVGSGGRVRDALTLGASVTVTHTSSVLAIGAVALLAGHFAVPQMWVPGLELVSGVLVLGLGLRLLWQRRWSRTHDHGHHHEHDHDHDHGARDHDHGARPGMASVVALGVSGGLVPCPEALGVMILAVGLGHIAVGMLLILSFSVGLAAVLIGIGVLLVRARTVAALSGRFSSGAPARLARLLPPASAIVVVALGAGLIARTLSGSG